MFSLREFLNLTYYTSKLDQFLHKYNKEHPTPSAPQLKEIEKYRRIYELRDNPNAVEPQKPTFWDKF